MAQRERALRAIVDAGAATTDTDLELAGLLARLQRGADAVEAVRAAAALEPASAEAQHRLATFCWNYANRGAEPDPAVRLKYIRDGLAAEDRAIALQPDYLDAMTYKNILPARHGYRASSSSRRSSIRRVRSPTAASFARSRCSTRRRSAP
jgi:hypothetical protein